MCSCLTAEPLDEQTVTQPAIAHAHGILPELAHYGPDDTGTGEYDLRAFWLQTDDRTTLFRVARTVHLDLAIDLCAVQHGALYDIRIVGFQAMHHRGDIGDRSTHADEYVGRRTTVDSRQVRGDGGKGFAE